MKQPIAIDYTAALEQGGGIGRYVRELIHALAQLDTDTPYKLFAAGQLPENLPQAPGLNFSWHSSTLSMEWFARLWHRARLPLPIERWTGDVALLHAPDFTLPPVRRNTRTLLTVHDLSFIRTPATSTPELRAYLERTVPRSVARADHILSDSESTRQDLIELYGTAPEKVSVLYSGVDAHFKPVADAKALNAVREKYDIGGAPFILGVGTVQPRKNYGRLVEAVHRLKHNDVMLVIAGGKGWLDDPLYEKIDALGFSDRMKFLGFVDDADLPALYSAAEVFAFPSLYEGFGLPVLESMACGTPVLASNTSSLPEVVGDAGLMVEPLETGAITAALAQLLDDEALRKTLIEKGFEQIKRFTWANAAQQLLAHYERLSG